MHSTKPMGLTDAVATFRQFSHVGRFTLPAFVELVEIWKLQLLKS